MMQFIPAIDVMDGEVVRLTKGVESTRKAYKKNPKETALEWQRQGAEYIHIIDLDAAFGKRPNTELILDIAGNLDVPIQMGGGIRSYEKAAKLLDKGIGRVILGSMPIKKPAETLRLLKDYGSERVVLALDHRNGMITITGWQEATEEKVDNVLERYIESGFNWFVVTNVDTDGMFTGPDIETFKRISSKASVIASGGVSRLSDLIHLSETEVKGVVVGKALYEGRFTVKEAIKEITKC